MIQVDKPVFLNFELETIGSADYTSYNISVWMNKQNNATEKKTLQTLCTITIHFLHISMTNAAERETLD